MKCRHRVHSAPCSGAGEAWRPGGGVVYCAAGGRAGTWPGGGVARPFCAPKAVHQLRCTLRDTVPLLMMHAGGRTEGPQDKRTQSDMRVQRHSQAGRVPFLLKHTQRTPPRHHLLRVQLEALQGLHPHGALELAEQPLVVPLVLHLREDAPNMPPLVTLLFGASTNAENCACKRCTCRQLGCMGKRPTRKAK